MSYSIELHNLKQSNSFSTCAGNGTQISSLQGDNSSHQSITETHRTSSSTRAIDIPERPLLGESLEFELISKKIDDVFHGYVQPHCLPKSWSSKSNNSF